MENKHLLANEKIMTQLQANTYMSTPKNNKLVHEYLSSKFKGGYGRLIYRRKMTSPMTANKKANTMHMIDKHFKQDFDTITEDDLIEYRDLLNNDKIKATLTKFTADNNPKSKRHVKAVTNNTEEPISFRRKQDYIETFNEFWLFLTEYVYQTERKRKLPDITRFFKLQRPAEHEEVKVRFIPFNENNDELNTLLSSLDNRHLKAQIAASIMSCARPCEICSVKFGSEHNLYKNNEGKWVIHKPRVKGVSYKNFPLVLDMYEDILVPYFETQHYNDGDKVFKYNEASFRRLMRYYTKNKLGKEYSPKILRKTGRMIRTQAKYSYDQINKICGHAPGSKVQKHYLNYDGLELDDESETRLKGLQYPNLKREYDEIKQRMAAMEERFNHQMDMLVKGQFKDKIKKILKEMEVST